MSAVLLADFGIGQLHACYVDALWRKDSCAMAGCFAEDGEWQITGQHLHGRKQIASAFEHFVSPLDRVLMRVGTPLLQINGNAASGRAYITEYVKKLDGSAACNIGIYEDRYVCTGTHWRFQSRVFTLAYTGSPDLSGPFLI